MKGSPQADDLDLVPPSTIADTPLSRDIDVAVEALRLHGREHQLDTLTRLEALVLVSSPGFHGFDESGVCIVCGFPGDVLFELGHGDERDEEERASALEAWLVPDDPASPVLREIVEENRVVHMRLDAWWAKAQRRERAFSCMVSFITGCVLAASGASWWWAGAFGMLSVIYGLSAFGTGSKR